MDYKKENSKLKKKGFSTWKIYNDSPTLIPGVRLFDSNDLASTWPDRKSVLFIDEISLLWDSRNFKKFDDGITAFFKLHRHAETVVYCASQAFDCDKRIRDVCTEFVVLSKIFGCICWIRPVKIIFPVFVNNDDNNKKSSGSDIVCRYEFYKFWKWKFYFMPKYFKYFNTRELPYRPRMKYSIPVRDPACYIRKSPIARRFKRSLKWRSGGSGSVRHHNDVIFPTGAY